MLRAYAGPGGERGASLATPGFPSQRAWKCILQESKVVLALFYRPDKL